MDLIQNISEFIPLCISVMGGVLFSSIIIQLIMNIRFFRQFGKLIVIICCPGVVLHEASHYLFIKLGGGAVLEAKFFTLSDPEAVGKVTSTPPESFLSNILIGIGPILINGLVVSLLVYFLPFLNEGLAYYLIFAFTVGALPSNTDLINIFSSIRLGGGRAIFELFSLFISIIPAWLLATWNVNTVYEINWLFFTIIYLVTLVGLVCFYKAAHKNK